MPEIDWKHLSRLKPLALERLCQQILAETRTLIDTAAEGQQHRTYLALYRHIQVRDQVVAACFNDWRRSHAMILLTNWRRLQLITDAEFAGFSAETRAKVDVWL